MGENLEVEDYKTGNIMRYLPNPTQKKLYELWANGPCREKVDAVIVNGDLCDGSQRKSAGKYVVSNDLGVQIRVCQHLLHMLPCNTFYITKGSEYHNQEDRPLDECVADVLRQNDDNSVQYGDELLIKVGGKTIHTSHNISVSTSAWQYRTTPLARDLMLMALSSKESEYGDVDWVLRSHAHYFALTKLGHMGGCITPGWQNKTPFAVMHDILGTPDIGYVVLEIEDGTIYCREKIQKVGPVCKKVEHESWLKSL
jgi:predicted phosphodiesterase